jgi:aspartyl aminopeptidase
MESWLRRAKQVLAEREAEAFCTYIDSTPSPFHLVDTTADRSVVPCL